MQKQNTSSTLSEYPARQEEAPMVPHELLIDVRTPAEFEAKHIPSSHNIPLDQLPSYKDELAISAGHARLVLVCQSGTRARKAADILQVTSLTTLTVLEGGIAAWEKEGKPLRLGSPKWSLERQVRGVAGTLVLLGALGGLFWKPLSLVAILIGSGLAYSALSNTCGMALVLSKLPYNQGATCDVRDTLKTIATTTH